MDAQILKNKFEAAGQGHVFKYFDKLSEGEKSALLAQLEQVDLAELDELNKELVFAEAKGAAIDFSKLEPAPYKPLPADKASDPEWREAKRVGEEAIRAGRLAAFVVAAGRHRGSASNAPKASTK